MILEVVPVGHMEANCYILASAAGKGAIIIDPGDDKQKIERALKKHSLKPALIINTHGHIDHIGCDGDFNVPVYIHRKDSVMLDDPALNLSALLGSSFSVMPDIKTVEEGDTVESDGVQLEVIHVPGHTPGGISLLLKKPQGKAVFTGDSLFYRGIGRTDFPGASESSLVRAIKEKLFKLSDDTVVYPGHGPSSTIGEEKENNPFL